MCKLWCMHECFASKHWENRHKVHFFKNELIRSYLENVKYVRKGGRVDKMSGLTFFHCSFTFFANEIKFNKMTDQLFLSLP